MSSGTASDVQKPLRLRVTAAAESIIRSGHPWVFAKSVREQNRPGSAGEIAIIYDRRDTFLALGLFDPESPIWVRVLHAGKPVAITRDWWRERLRKPVDLRRQMFDDHTTGYRFIHGESDGWPGLVLDRYGDCYVLKLYTAAWLPRLTEVQSLLAETISPSRLVLRLSRNIQANARTQFGRQDGEWLAGSGVETRPVFLENALRFEADVTQGQKTGFFLDQRENRRQVEELARGRAVLNAFSFSGGFSLYAARGGARSVTDIDLSAHALASGERNFHLNQQSVAVAACHREAVQADAFDWLKQNRGAKFDMVILDPPSLARRESERAGAIQAYATLARSGLTLLRRGGILVAASCSAHVSAAEFFGVVRAAAVKLKQPFVELFTTEHPPDHPATFPEGQYLKCIFLQVRGL